MEGEETLIDVIPLVEVTKVEAVGQNSETDRPQAFLTELETSLDLTNTILIRTRAGGYNAGRNYFIRAGSANECTDIIQEMKINTNLSVQKEKARNKFKHRRTQIRKVYESSIFQGFAALLIVAVMTSILTNFDLPIIC
jgi:hypothetical protein